MVRAMTRGSALGETTKVAPVAATARTSSGVSTVPAPIRARSPSAACIAAMLFSGSGEFSGTSIQPMPASTMAAAVSTARSGGDAAQDGDQRAGHGASPFGLEPVVGGGEPGEGQPGGVGGAGGEAGERQRVAVGGDEAGRRRSAPRRGRASRAAPTASSAPISRPESRERATTGSSPCSSAAARSGKSRAGDALGAGEAVLDRLEEGVVGPAVGGQRLAQHRGAGEEGEDLAGHVAGEADHLAGADVRPLRVGAGQAGDPVEAGLVARAGRRSGSPRRASRRPARPGAGPAGCGPRAAGRATGGRAKAAGVGGHGTAA